jgi:Rieske Fe-S protein
MADKNILLIKNASLDYDIALVKKSKTEFVALKMVCTHRLNPVTLTEKGFYCPSHGSEYDIDGNVKKGPAPSPLKRFPTLVQKGKAIISL